MAAAAADTVYYVEPVSTDLPHHGTEHTNRYIPLPNPPNPFLKADSTIQLGNPSGTEYVKEGQVAPSSVVIRNVNGSRFICAVAEYDANMKKDAELERLLAHALRRPPGTRFDFCIEQGEQGGVAWQCPWVMPWKKPHAILDEYRAVYFRYTVPGLSPSTRFGYFYMKHSNLVVLSQ